MPLSSTGIAWRISRPRRTTRPPVRARSASRTAPIAWIVDGTNASATGHHQPELVEGARRRLHQLVVRHHRVERAEHRHHADDDEALGGGLEHDLGLDRAAHRETPEQLGQRERRRA